MARDDFPGASRALPLLDSGERERLSFWRNHAIAIQSDLLEITGWLSQAGDRDVLTDAKDHVRAVPASSGPANVLFLAPREGTGAYQNWEWCLGYLRMEQSRRRLVRQMVKEAEAAVKAAEAELELIRSRHEELDARLRETEPKARGEVVGGSTPSPTGPYARLVEGLAEARENLAEYRSAERRRDRLRLRLEGLRDHLVPRVYPGLWARVNAFLDLQALSVANLASEEFRKVPRPLAGLAARLERDLEGD